MRAVKCKNNHISLISKPEAKIYAMIEADGFISCDSLDERDSFVAEELYKQNILKKVRKNNCMGYKTYSESL